MIQTLHRYIHEKITPLDEQQLMEWLHNPSNEKEINAYYKQLWTKASPDFPSDVCQRVLDHIAQQAGWQRNNGWRFRRTKTAPCPHRGVGFYLRAAAAIAATVVVAVLSFKYGADLQESLVARGEMIEHYVPYGHRELVTLPDGSTAWLNAGSVLIYPREFKGSTRSVYLSGEGNFEVRKNRAKAFIVRTKHLDVEALGTVFCVESYPGATQTSATLESGSIRVAYTTVSNPPTLLKPDQRLVFDHGSKIIRLSTVDSRLYASWVDGSMVFKDETFDRIVAHLERKFNVTVNYHMEKYRGKRFFLRFVPDESLDQILPVFSSVAGGFRYTVRDTEVTIR